MTTFPPLNVPDTWQNYWSKYPEGYTILEALLNWVKQVDDLTTNVNDWNTRLDAFVNSFDTDLQGTVTKTLTDWQTSGFLNVVLNDALQSQLDEITVLADQKGAKGDGVTDDTGLLQSVINSMLPNQTLLFPDGKTFLISGTLTISQPMTLKGKGKLLKKAGANCVSIQVNSDNVKIIELEIDGNRNAQTVLDFHSNEINLTNVKNCLVEKCYIHDSAGGGVSVLGSSRNRILNNRIENVHDNSIIIANVGADYNLIQGNTLDRTTAQNNIFITANSGSQSTTDKIYGNEITDNWCFNAGDTGIESGIHAIGTIIKSNHVYNSVNPPILLREGQYCIIEGNVVDVTNSTNQTNVDGISTVSQLSDSNHIQDSYSIIKGNQVRGAGRYGIAVQGHSNINIEGNEVNNCGYGVYIQYDGHMVKNNKLVDCTIGISLDQNGATNCDQATIDGNSILRATSAIVIYAKTLNNVTIRNNKIKDSVTNTIHAQASTAQNSFLYGNEIIGAGSADNLDIFIRQLTGSTGATVPLNQYDPQVIATPTDIGTVMIRFGSEFAIVHVALGTYSVALHSANVYTDLTGFNGWGIGVDGSNNILLQRRGATITGNIPYTLSFTQA